MSLGNGPGLWKGKTVLVTGATRGIGRACVEAFADAGAQVAIGCRDLAQGQALARELNLRQGGERVFAVHMDTADAQSAAAAIKQAVDVAGGLSVLVNNAGFSVPAPALEARPEDFDAMFSVNVRGAYFAAQAAARHMKEAGGGAIVNIASQAGLVALRDESLYGMTKAALLHMTRCLAVEWGAYGIRVNAVAPTFIRTEGAARWLDTPSAREGILSRIPLGRVGAPQDVAQPVMYLASEAAALVTGATLTVDGGWTCQ